MFSLLWFQDCRQPFQHGSFFDHEGLPYCETHYHAKRGSLCAGCSKPITGRCITAMFRKFHPEHFVCAFCLKQLNKGTFKEQNDKPYCHACFDKLFGWEEKTWKWWINENKPGKNEVNLILHTKRNSFFFKWINLINAINTILNS